MLQLPNKFLVLRSELKFISIISYLRFQMRSAHIVQINAERQIYKYLENNIQIFVSDMKWRMNVIFV